MAVCRRNGLALAILMFPAITFAYRPFSIPTNLFSPALKDAHLPEGAREIRWQDSEDSTHSDIRMSDVWSQAGKHLTRTRRAVSLSPSSPSIVEVSLVQVV